MATSTIFGDIFHAILVSKDRNKLRTYSGDTGALPSFIVSKTLSRHDQLRDEDIMNLLAIMPSTPLDNEACYVALSQALPKCKSAWAKKW